MMHMQNSGDRMHRTHCVAARLLLPLLLPLLLLLLLLPAAASAYAGRAT